MVRDWRELILAILWITLNMRQWWQEPSDNFFIFKVANTSSCHFRHVARTKKVARTKFKLSSWYLGHRRTHKHKSWTYGYKQTDGQTDRQMPWQTHTELHKLGLIFTDGSVELVTTFSKIHHKSTTAPVIESDTDLNDWSLPGSLLQFLCNVVGHLSIFLKNCIFESSL